MNFFFNQIHLYIHFSVVVYVTDEALHFLIRRPPESDGADKSARCLLPVLFASGERPAVRRRRQQTRVGSRPPVGELPRRYARRHFPARKPGR